jgi:hypothetical protein
MLVLPLVARTEAGDRTDEPVPFIMVGDWVRSLVQRPWTERAARESDLQVQHGHELTEYFLFSGLKRRPSSVGRRRRQDHD